ncbi:GAF and ANTAR domain-containing protein [Streptomyces sp. NRRL S-920]|uniref:GAF and ANTAR domain-containing protein n=1 Tax=Streptomyces sp. NRRL S-920 TaxID=1463921 RepID=UPI00068CAA4C|nr:GAF and ANTAR domain-containing protein [Streptomyces sp. NRRL S-920]
MDDDEHAAAWRSVGSADGSITLATACRACAADLDIDCLGVTLVVGGELRLLAHVTDERARRLEDAQLTTGEGPCTEAYVGRALVEEADLDRAFRRWPAFTQAAAEQRLRSVTALPLTTGHLRVGAVNLYRAAPGLLTARHKALARGYARILALLAIDEHPHLATAEYRPVRPGPQGYPPSVHMAAGVLAEAYQLPPDDALARMRAHAFRHDQPLHQTAEHVLTHHTLD